jgi:hypothetical protein
MTLFLLKAVYGGLMIKYVDLVTTYPEDILTKTVVDCVLAQLELKLHYVACPIHHESPQILLVGPVTDLKIEVRGCCQAFVDQVWRILAAGPA